MISMLAFSNNCFVWDWGYKPCPYGAYSLMQKTSNKQVNKKYVVLGRDKCCEER